MIISLTWARLCVRCGQDLSQQKDRFSIVIPLWGRRLMARFRICQRCVYEGVVQLGDQTTRKKLADWMGAPKRGS